jgi:hypothetical protein
MSGQSDGLGVSPSPSLCCGTVRRTCASPARIFRNPNTLQMRKRLQAVTDGGQLIAIADSAGEIDASYAGSGYGQTSWRGAGVMTRG